MDLTVARRLAPRETSFPDAAEPSHCTHPETNLFSPLSAHFARSLRPWPQVQSKSPKQNDPGGLRTGGGARRTTGTPSLRPIFTTASLVPRKGGGGGAGSRWGPWARLHRLHILRWVKHADAVARACIGARCVKCSRAAEASSSHLNAHVAVLPLSCSRDSVHVHRCGSPL